MTKAEQEELAKQHAKPSKERIGAAELTGAWDERNRIFNDLRNPNNTDERLLELKTEYTASSKAIDTARANFTK